ncbi:hypothetical protein HNV09_025880, partial [Oceanispirochaeta sp. M2]
EMEDLAVHSHNIRNNFFDSTKRLVDVIPNVLLRTEENLDPELSPRERSPLDAVEAKKAPPKAKPAKPSKEEPEA